MERKTEPNPGREDWNVTPSGTEDTTTSGVTRAT